DLARFQGRERGRVAAAERGQDGLLRQVAQGVRVVGGHDERADLYSAATPSARCRAGLDGPGRRPVSITDNQADLIKCGPRWLRHRRCPSSCRAMSLAAQVSHAPGRRRATRAWVQVRVASHRDSRPSYFYEQPPETNAA